MTRDQAVKRRNRLRAGEPAHELRGVLSPLAASFVVDAAKESGNLSDSLYFERLVRYLIDNNGTLPVLTDSLEAAAVQAVGDVEEAAVASAQAGVDLILTTGRGSYIHVYRALLAKARQDPEFRRAVRASAARVLAAQ